MVRINPESKFKLENYISMYNLNNNGEIMRKKGIIRPNDLLAIIVIVVGGLGFILWGLGISTLGNATLRWLGAIIVAFVGFIITVLERWLK